MKKPKCTFLKFLRYFKKLLPVISTEESLMKYLRISRNCPSHTLPNHHVSFFTKDPLLQCEWS
jgi:hypothetical protein